RGNMEHPKDVGDRSTLAIISVLRELGYGIYLPFGENTRCDLMLERDSFVDRVQRKTGRLRQGGVVFRVCSSYAHHRSSKFQRRSYHGEIDLFAVYCPETQASTSSRSPTCLFNTAQRCASIHRATT